MLCQSTGKEVQVGDSEDSKDILVGLRSGFESPDLRGDRPRAGRHWQLLPHSATRTRSRVTVSCMYVYYCRTYEKLRAGGERGEREDMC